MSLGIQRSLQGSFLRFFRGVYLSPGNLEDATRHLVDASHREELTALCELFGDAMLDLADHVTIDHETEPGVADFVFEACLPTMCVLWESPEVKHAAAPRLALALREGIIALCEVSQAWTAPQLAALHRTALSLGDFGRRSPNRGTRRPDTTIVPASVREGFGPGTAVFRSISWMHLA